jgi:hypothetical protein
MKKLPSLKFFYLVCEDKIIEADSDDDEEEENSRVIDEVSFIIDVAARFFYLCV